MSRIGGCARFRGNGGERGLGIMGEEDRLGGWLDGVGPEIDFCNERKWECYIFLLYPLSFV